MKRVMIVVGVLVLMAGCGGEAEPKVAARQQAPAPAAAAAPVVPTPPTPPPAPTPQIRVPAGKFIFGTTEEQFQYFLSHSMINYPGMVDKLRKTFVIPTREVDVPEFAIDQFEVTNEQYRQFLAETGYKPADPTNYLKHWTGDTSYPSWAATFPVVWISQEDAQVFCQWRGGRLPTEEEWEKAARGTDGRVFPWGNTYPSQDTSNLAFGTTRTEPVGNRPEDKSPFEVYDMGGNVSELTASTVKGARGRVVVVRGGNYISGGREAAVYKRSLFAPESVRSETIGCRCVGK